MYKVGVMLTCRSSVRPLCGFYNQSRLFYNTINRCFNHVTANYLNTALLIIAQDCQVTDLTNVYFVAGK